MFIRADTPCGTFTFKFEANKSLETLIRRIETRLNCGQVKYRINNKYLEERHLKSPLSEIFKSDSLTITAEKFSPRDEKQFNLSRFLSANLETHLRELPRDLNSKILSYLPINELTAAA